MHFYFLFLSDQECANSLWKFFRQALASPHVKVDTVFREMLNLSRSFPGCRPFANEPKPQLSADDPSSFFAKQPTSGAKKPTSGAAVASVLAPSNGKDVCSPQDRVDAVKRGSTLEEVAMSRARRRHGSSPRPASRTNSKRGRTSLAGDKRNIKMVRECVFASISLSVCMCLCV